VHRIVISACLLGAKVRYHGGAATILHPTLQRWRDEGRLVTICPEVDGGLGTPRPPAEISGPDTGRGVVARLAFVRTADGGDVTNQFLDGASIALDAARRNGARIAILKDGSPSCGSSFVYDGTFSGTRTGGSGVTAALLAENSIRVFSENQIDDAERWLQEINRRESTT
jgi:uncharacterized protein YbbK (DUF523 family)